MMLNHDNKRPFRPYPHYAPRDACLVIKVDTLYAGIFQNTLEVSHELCMFVDMSHYRSGIYHFHLGRTLLLGKHMETDKELHMVTKQLHVLIYYH